MAIILVNDVGLEFPSVSFDEVPPGQKYSDVAGGPLELKVKNTDPTAITDRVILAREAYGYDMFQNARFSLDGLTFTPGPLALGAFAGGEEKTVYFDIDLPEGAAGGRNQRFEIVVRAGSV